MGDHGDGTFRNLILAGDYSAPDPIRVGKDYYMASSTFACSPGVTIPHSRDLVNWETTWAPKGQTPVVKTTGARFGFNMISAISPKGLLRFMVVEGTVGADQFIEFIKRLAHGTKRRIFLIVDGHPTHKAKKVRSFVESLNGQVSLHLLPGYSPELNPDEWVWRNLKSGVMGKLQHLTKQSMKMEAVSHLRRLQKQPNIVRSFFHSETTRYAA